LTYYTTPIVEILPNDCIKIDKTKGGFTKYPFGMPMANNFPITFYLDGLNQTFKNALLSNATESNGQYFDLTIVVGIKKKFETDYTIYFVGAKEKNAEDAYGFEPYTFKADFVNITKKALDNITIGNFIDNIGSPTQHTNTFFAAHKGSNSYVIWWGWNNINSLKFYTLNAFYTTFSNAFSSYIHKCTRNIDNFGYINKPKMNYYRQSYNTTNVRGNLLNDNELLLLGLIQGETVDNNNSPIIGDIGGKLYKVSSKFKDSYDEHPESFGKYNGWDLLGDLYKDELGTGIIDYAYSQMRDKNNNYFQGFGIGITDYHNSTPLELSFTLNSFLKPFDFKTGSNICEKIEVAYNEQYELDIAKVCLNNNVNDNSQPYNISTIFNNCFTCNAENLNKSGNDLQFLNNINFHKSVLFYGDSNVGGMQVSPFVEKTLFNNYLAKIDSGAETIILFILQNSDYSKSEAFQTLANYYQQCGKNAIIAQAVIETFGKDNQIKISVDLSLDFAYTNKLNFLNFHTAHFDLYEQFGKEELKDFQADFAFIGYEIDWDAWSVKCEYLSFNKVA